MLKLRRYVIVHLPVLLISVVLLFIQAYSDLKLPDYMSDIVNVGIQQNGLTSATPNALSEDGYRLLVVLSDREQQAQLAAAYTYHAEGVDQAGVHTSQAVYLLNRDADSENLENLPGQALWTLINLMGNQGTSQISTSSITEVDLTPLYAMLPELEAMPQEALAQARTAAASLDAQTLEQSGIILTTAFLTDAGVDVSAMRQQYILIAGAKMLGMALIGTFATIIVVYLIARMSAAISRAIRADVFAKVMTFSSEAFDRFSSASLITRSTNDVSQIQMFFGFGIRMLIYAPILGIGAIIAIARQNQSMTWIIALAVGVLLIIMIALFVLVFPKFKTIQKLVDRLNLVAREALSGIMVVRAFSTQDFEQKRFASANRNLADVNLFVGITTGAMMPVMMLVMNLISVLIIWVGGHQVAQSNLQIGTLLAFIQYTMQIIMAFLMVSMMFILIPRASVSAGRIAEVLETEDAIINPQHPKAQNPQKLGEVVFDHVSFGYADAQEDVLHDISFTAKPGQTTAFIGSTGSGKSTIINLIPRFYDVRSGEILVGGVNVRQQNLRQLRASVAFVPQKGALLSGTIRSNLVYGKPDATDAEVTLAMEIAQASEFISRYPEGVETAIAQGGTNVSGGQRQRLSIARALVKDASILIFDDSFSALDFKTDQQLRKALDLHVHEKTILIVAQRVNTIMDADQIVVLDEGRVVGIGTHHELLTTCPTYHEIAASQLTEKELAR